MTADQIILVKHAVLRPQIVHEKCALLGCGTEQVSTMRVGWQEVDASSDLVTRVLQINLRHVLFSVSTARRSRGIRTVSRGWIQTEVLQLTLKVMNLDTTSASHSYLFRPIYHLDLINVATLCREAVS